MADWQEPVFDRTQADVDYAKTQLKLRNNTQELKGCVNITDILRIENNTRYLADRLCDLYYFNNITTLDSWVISNIPQTKQINRIINNVAVLRDKYYTPVGATNLPATLLHYEQINAIEQNHFLLKKHIEEMIGYYRECGTFACGEEI